MKKNQQEIPPTEKPFVSQNVEPIIQNNQQPALQSQTALKEHHKQLSLLFLKEIFSKGRDYYSIANLLIQGDIDKLNYPKEVKQDICNRTLAFVDFEKLHSYLNTAVYPIHLERHSI